MSTHVLLNSESESAKYSKNLYKSITWSACANGRNQNRIDHGFRHFRMSCSCIIVFIKRIGEKDKVRGFVEHLIGFPQRV